jgi:predicted dehydrogenase
MASMATERGALRVGVVGCGYAAERLHLPALRSLGSARVVAIADTDAERLHAIGRRFAIDRRYGAHEALVQDAEVDAVAVCVPPSAHATVVLAALEARKHVLVEKPLCLDLAEADRLVERARGSTLTVMVGFNLRYHRHVRAARRAIARGLVGPVELARSVWSTRLQRHAGLPEWRRRRELGGGVLNEMAVHHVDLWRYLLDGEVTEVFASTRAGETDDETATLTARLRDGALAISGFSQGAADTHEIEILGRQGRLRVRPYRVDGFEVAPASASPDDLARRALGLLRAVRAVPRAAAGALQGGMLLDSYRAEWRHFAGCARRGVPAACTVDDGLRALELVSAAIDSTRIGRPVAVTRRGGGGEPRDGR